MAVLLLLAAAAALAATAAATADPPRLLYGLTLVANGPAHAALMTIDPAAGNVTLVGPSLDTNPGTDDCRAIDTKRGIYYYLGDSKAGAVLVGLSLADGTVQCSSDVPLREIGFVGIGQSLKFDAARDTLILSGLAANSTGGLAHQILRSAGPDLSAGAAATKPPSCAKFTKAGTFPELSDSEPMLHSTAYDEATQTLYVTVIPKKGEFAVAVIDLVAKQMTKVELEGTPPVDEMTGMSWDVDSGSLIGTMQDGHAINLLSLDPKAGKWTVRKLAAPPVYGLGGNSGDVHSYDSTTGMWYALLMDEPIAPGVPVVKRIGVIDWSAGALVSQQELTWPLIGGQPDPFRSVIQMELA